MSAAETIAAAIAKLEQAKSSHEPGPRLDLRNVDRRNVLWFDWASDVLKRDKRSIDAQIRVLQLDARLRKAHRPPYSGAALALAEAILGGVS